MKRFSNGEDPYPLGFRVSSENPFENGFFEKVVILINVE
jgi:hypothetical protein